jgi:hypothetical protein
MRIDTAGRGCPPWARLGEQARILRPVEAWVPDQTRHLSSERHGIIIGNGYQAYQGHAPEDKHDASMLMIARQRRSLLTLPIFSALLAFVAGLFRSRASLCLENLALRHQLAVYQQTVYRPRLRSTDRVFWAWLSRLWLGWQDALAFVQPPTVIAWQQQRFRDHWQRVSQQGKPSRLRLPRKSVSSSKT